MKKKKLLASIRREYKAGRNWTRLDWPDWRRCYKLMFDASDGEFWCDAFLNRNEWKVYHSKTILAVPLPLLEKRTIPDTEAAILDWCLYRANQGVIEEE